LGWREARGRQTTALFFPPSATQLDLKGKMQECVDLFHLLLCQPEREIERQRDREREREREIEGERRAGKQAV
jgi:hypothetical protein